MSLTPAPANKPIVSLHFYLYADFERRGYSIPEGGGQALVMRESTAKEFNLKGVLHKNAAESIYLCTEDKTRLVFDKENRRILVFLSAASKVRIIELFRDLIIKNEESAGTLILHASAVRKDNKTIAILGAKGAGKTTLMLNLLLNHKCQLLTGDKLFLMVDDGKIRVKGWPDYPHLGAGTIKQYPVLEELVSKHYGRQIATMEAKEKILIDPRLFAGELQFTVAPGEYLLDFILLPRITGDEPCSCAPVREIPQEAVIGNLIFSGDYFQTKWHDFIVPDYSKKEESINRLIDRLGTLRYFKLGGDLKITATQREEIFAC
jgi:energy-coupling factor transporter ATP-binding protein EcfA2